MAVKKYLFTLCFFIVFPGWSIAQKNNKRLHLDFGYGIAKSNNNISQYKEIFNYNAFLFDVRIRRLKKTGLQKQQTYNGFDVNIVSIGDSVFIHYMDRSNTNLSLLHLYSSNEEAYNKDAFSIDNCYEVFAGERKYILFYVGPHVTNSSWIPLKGVLLDISNKKVTPFPNYQYSNSAYCLTDVDRNGILDYLLFNPSLSDTAKFYHYINGKFVPDGKYYISLKSIGDGYLYTMDLKKSSVPIRVKKD